MAVRWCGRGIGLTIVAALLAGSSAGAAGAADAAAGGSARWELVWRTAKDGAVVLRVPLADGRFGLAYRNSVYGSAAAERFVVTDDGRLALVGLAAAEAAVLAEYYGATQTPSRAASGTWAGWWHTPPASHLVLTSLTVAATAHGQRTLVVEGTGQRIELWRIADDARRGITLEARPGG